MVSTEWNPYQQNSLPPCPPARIMSSNMREDHFSTASDSPITTPIKGTDHTGLSPQAAHLFINRSSSSMDKPTSSYSAGTKRKILTHLKEEDAATSVLHSTDDASSTATTS